MGVFEKPEVEKLLENRDWLAIRNLMQGRNVPDIADLLLELDKSGRVMLFRCLPRSLSADVFSEFESSDQDALLTDLTDEETRNLMASLRPDDRTSLLEELPGQATQRLLNVLGPEDLREVRYLLGYPERSVGRIMTPDYVAIRPDWTVERTMAHIRKMGRDSETINMIYVTDKDWHLVGAVTLRHIVIANADEIIGQLMHAPAISLSAFADREEAARTMERYGLFVLPVVDSGGILVGIVTGDDVFEIAREETTEDFHKSAAISPLKGSFRDAGVGLLYKNRIAWLMALIFVDIVAAGIMARYEDTIAKVVPLVFFLPLLIGCGGNVGSQSSTLVIRSLALGEVELKDWSHLLVKELGISTAIGITISFAIWGPGVLRGGPGVGLVVALSGVAIVVVSSLIGISSPFLLSKLGFDPAASSSPLITSLADILGVLIYFSLATWYLRI